MRKLGVIVYQGPSLLDGSEIVAILTRGSANAKTGDMPQLWILVAGQAPGRASRNGNDAAICGDCPHRKQADGVRTCYVQVDRAPVSVWSAWQRGRYTHATDKDFREITAGRTVRLGAYGDPAALPRDVLAAVCRHATAHVGYTHQWRLGLAMQDFAMASCETMADVVLAASLGYRAFLTTAYALPRAAGFMVCPASEEAGKRLQCSDCRSCSGAGNGARAHVQIAIHGAAGKASVRRLAVVQ